MKKEAILADLNPAPDTYCSAITAVTLKNATLFDGIEMKLTVMQPTEIDVEYVQLTLPVGGSSMPIDFPLRDGDVWTALISIDDGQINDWPVVRHGGAYRVVVPVAHDATCELLTYDFKVLAESRGGVNYDLIPPFNNSYVLLNISSAGTITNWPDNPDVSDFF